MTQDHRELAPLRCPECRYDLMGFRVGDQCPECGTVISAHRRSNHSARLVRAARYIAIPGVFLALLSSMCMVTSLWFLTIPILTVIFLAAFLFAIFAKINLGVEQCYDDRARDELRIAFYAFPVYLSIIILFILADILIAFTNSVL